MQKVIMAVWIGLFYVFGAIAHADTAQADVLKTGMMWEKALESRNPQEIVSLYAPNAYLYPTFENIKDSHDQILEYFVGLSKNNNLKVVFDKQHIQVFGDVAINSGFYTFSYEKSGKIIRVPARYTFVYLHQGNHWIIVNHHSSVLPKS